MSVKQLSYHTALTPGSDLWILSEKKYSSWTRKIDWYLNFQISRKFPCISLSRDQIKKLTGEWELSQFNLDLDSENRALMIASEHFLPNTKTVILPFVNQQVKLWVEEALKIRKNIKCPSLRLFFPDDQHYEKADRVKLMDQLSPITNEFEVSFVSFKSQK